MNTYTPEEQKLLDQFAGLTAAGIVATITGDIKPRGVASAAYLIAEAMLEERRRRMPQPGDSAPAFTEFGETWTRHTPGAACPCDQNTWTDIVALRPSGHKIQTRGVKAGDVLWGNALRDGDPGEIIGWKLSQAAPADNTFEAHGHTWTRHTPGDPMPCDDHMNVFILRKDGQQFEGRALGWYWDEKDTLREEARIIGWRPAT